MQELEKKIQIFDFIVLFLLILAGCVIGKYVMNNTSNSFLGFNGPAITILLGGELLWSRTRRYLVKKWEKGMPSTNVNIENSGVI